MTGEELRDKAINGAQGWLRWVKLSPRSQGLWNRAAMEVTHLEEKVAALTAELAAFAPR